MEKTKLSRPTSNFFESVMEKACASFEADCSQARRGLRVSMAVKVFGVGTLIPNNLGDEDTGRQWRIATSQPTNDDESSLPITREPDRQFAAGRSTTMGLSDSSRLH